MFRTHEVSAIVGLIVFGLAAATPGLAQQRGQYLSGMFADNSGVMPEPGFTYANMFYYSSSDRLKGPYNPIPVDGQFAIMVDNNIFIYVFKPKILGGNIEAIADIPIANGSVAGSVFASGRPVNGGGGGLANSYFVPVQIGWHMKRLDVQTGLAFFAPTGRYTPGANNNVGTGYMSTALQAGATIYITANKGLSLNTFSIYTWNGTQQGTNIRPGQNESFDYSLTQMLPLAKGKYLLQGGFAGYGQWQTSDSTRTIQALANSRYGVAALGFTANLIVPSRKLVVGSSAFWEMGAYNTREGHVLMISASFSFDGPK